jgi:hypothetical protein
VLVALAIGAGPARAAMYKWVDDKGITHYTDTMPPDAVNKGNVELNKQGVTIKKTDPAVTPEQRKAREAEVEQQRELAKQKEAQARKDRALLDSYTTESDIDLAKNRSLRTVENALQSAQAYSTQLTKRKAELTANKAALGSKPVPAALERDHSATDGELTRQEELIARKKQELVTIAARYDSDKERWQALRGRGAIPDPSTPGKTSAGSATAQAAPATAQAAPAKK